MPPAILQVFNRYLERGGEEVGVGRFAEILARRCRFDECIFDSAEWKGNNAPAPWQQLLWMFHNPRSVRRLREKQGQIRARAWLVHNIFPVGSPSVYDEALRQKIPIVQFIHNFRPFSITGYRNHEAMRASQWPRAYLRNCRGRLAKIAAENLCPGLRFDSCDLRNQLRAVKAWAAISDFMRDRFIGAGLPAEKIFRLYPPCVPVNARSQFSRGGLLSFHGAFDRGQGHQGPDGLLEDSAWLGPAATPRAWW